MRLPIVIVLLPLLFSKCNSKDDYIRDVYVNIEIDLSLPEYSDLDAVGNSIFIEGGNKGLIIYHAGINEYNIYDRNCSYEPSLACSYIDSINSTIAYCKCCPSAFLMDQKGIAANTPALLPLKQYHYAINGQILHVFN